MNASQLPDRYADAPTFRFGDSETMCKWLLALVREGAKTATCGALRDFEGGVEAMPEVGRRDVALNWDGSPALVIETLEVVRRRFREVDEAFALDEGETDDLARLAARSSGVLRAQWRLRRGHDAGVRALPPGGGPRVVAASASRAAHA